MVTPPYSDLGLLLSPGSKYRRVLEPLLLLSESSPSLVAIMIHLAFLEGNRNSPSELCCLRRSGSSEMIALWRRDVEDVRKAISPVVYAGGDSEKKGSDGWSGVNGARRDIEEESSSSSPSDHLVVLSNLLSSVVQDCLPSWIISVSHQRQVKGEVLGQKWQTYVVLLGRHADDVLQPMARVSLALGGESEPFNVDMTFSDVQDLLGSLKEASSVLELMLEEGEEDIETNSDEPPQQ